MNKTRLLLNVAENMRNLADSIQEFCEAIANEECIDETSDEIKSDVDTAEQSQLTESKSQISLEEVRGILAKKAQVGKQAKVRELIQSYGVDRLSEVEEVYYEELIKKAEEL